MKLIDDTLFDKISNDIDDLDMVFDLNNKLDVFYRNYILLENYPNYFKEVSLLDIFYNKYYFFLAYSYLIQQENGFDAGLEQQEFKILEEGEEFEFIDWDIVEFISNTIKNLPNAKSLDQIK